jgi:hypothetical protein
MDIEIIYKNGRKESHLVEDYEIKNSCLHLKYCGGGTEIYSMLNIKCVVKR